MDAEGWADLKTAFEDLLALPVPERNERLATLAAADPQFHRELTRLFVADASADRRLRTLESPLSRGGVDAEGISWEAAGTAAPDPLGLSGRSVSHFEVQEVLGCGGMGVVYRARDLQLGRSVALKLLLPQYSLDARAKQRFLQEARAASALDHPHVCTIYEAGETAEGLLFLAMGCYTGETLHARLCRCGALPLGETVELVRQTADGLGAAHAAGIVHRDLKPGNLMLAADGTVKILDFGIAKVRDVSLTGSSPLPGTAAYMSPEQVRNQPVDARSDLWSLGVVFYEMLTGRAPFGAHGLSAVYRILHEAPAAPSALRPDLPPEIEAIVLRLLRKEPQERFASAAEVLEAISDAGSRSPSRVPAASNAPPSRDAGRRLLNLPAPPTPIVGRQVQVREVRERLGRVGVRLLTLTGPGGVGKTRLAVQIAAELAPEFRDGACFVNLAPITDPVLLPSATAEALGVREATDRPLIETLAGHLREKRILIVFDNFEHLVETAPVVSRILAEVPGLKVLVTSRTPLHVQGEHEYSVPPLSLPDPHPPPLLEQLSRSEAVQLFVDRARRVRSDFALTDDNAAAIVEICRRLDGLPLAIELAAARIRILPPRAILARLANRLRLLSGGARDLPVRHQTLRDAIGWSHELLDGREKLLFRRLSVFAGGRSLEAIEAVCRADNIPAEGRGSVQGQDLLEEITSLVDKSLLRAEQGHSGEPRFVMLETIHEYAAEKLQESGEADRVSERHAEFFLALAEAAEPQLIGPEQGRWLARLVAEHDNLRAALGWLMSTDAGGAARLGGALWRFWNKLGHYREGRRWLEEALAAADLPAGVRAKALLGASVLANFQNDAAAEAMLEEGLALARSAGDRSLIAAILQGLGHAARIRGEAERATQLYEQALTMQRDLGDRRGASVVLSNLGSLAHVRGDLARAQALSEESLKLAREVGDTTLAAFALHTLGQVAFEQGDLGRAAALLRESLRTAREAGDLRILVFAIAHLALVAGTAGATERAARLAGAAEAQFATLGTQMNPPVREKYDRRLAAIRDRADPPAWRRTWVRGQEMTLEQAVAAALEVEPPTYGSGGAEARAPTPAPPEAP